MATHPTPAQLINWCRFHWNRAQQIWTLSHYQLHFRFLTDSIANPILRQTQHQFKQPVNLATFQWCTITHIVDGHLSRPTCCIKAPYTNFTQLCFTRNLVSLKITTFCLLHDITTSQWCGSIGTVASSMEHNHQSAISWPGRQLCGHKLAPLDSRWLCWQRGTSIKTPVTCCKHHLLLLGDR
jgi:hypothetical protein